MRFSKLRAFFGRTSRLSPSEKNRKVRRPFKPAVELLELRAVPAGAFTNVLVNNPAVDDTTIHDNQSTVSLVVAPGLTPGQNTLVASFQDSGVQSLSSPPRVDAWSASTNGGASYNYKGRFLVFTSDPTSATDGGNPVVVRDSTTDTIYYMFVSQPFTSSSGTTIRRPRFTTSTDHGNSAAVSTHAAAPPIFNYNTVSNLSVAVDNFSAGGGQGYLFSAFEETRVATPPVGVTGAPPGLHFAYSANGGVSWNFPTATNGPSTTDPDKPLYDTTAHGADVVVGPNGDVYVFFLVSTLVSGSTYANQIYMDVSTDLGAHWGVPTTVSPVLNNTAANGSLGFNFYTDSFPRAAVNPINGDLYLTYNDTPVAGGSPQIVFERLNSAGVIEQSATLNDDSSTTNDHWEPALAVSPDGKHLFTDWNDTRGGSLSAVNVWGVIGSLDPSSLNATVSFGPNFEVSNVKPLGSPNDSFPTIPGTDSAGGGTSINIMGNYNAVAAAPGVFYTNFTATFPSAKHSGNQANVVSATIPLVSGSIDTGSNGIVAGTAYSGQVATFTTPDNGAEGSFTASIDWGDGTTPTAADMAGPSAGVFTISASTNPHTYAASGSYYVTITVQDAEGSVSLIQGLVRVNATALSDPDFTSPSVGTGSSAYQYNPVSAYWTFTGFSGLAGNGSAFTSMNPNAPQGTQVAFVQKDGSISQVVNFASTGSYLVRFSAAQRAPNNQQTIQIELDGTVVGTVTPLGNNYAAYNTASLAVSSGNHTLAFVGLNPLGGDNMAFIDQVAIVDAPTPQLSDPGFEEPSLGSGTLAYQYNPVGDSWTFTDLAGVTGNGSNFTGANPNAPQGTQVAFLQKTGSASEVVNFASSGNYAITLSAAQRSGNSQTFQINVDNAVVGTITPVGSAYATYNTIPFAVTAGTHTITIVGTNPHGGDNTAFIDNVTLATSAAFSDPEFATPNEGTGITAYQYNPTGGSWSFGGLSGLAGNGSAFTNMNPNAPQGTQVAFLQGATATISQTNVNFPTTGSYVIGFSAAQRSGNSQTIQVQLDGSVVGTITPRGSTYTFYTTPSIPVTAGNHSVTFLGTNASGDNTAFLSEVTITAGGPVFSDPGFESPNLGTGSSAYAYNPNSPRPTSPWTFNSGTGVAGNASAFTGGNPSAPQGTQVAFLQGTSSSISQTIEFATGGAYIISFLAAQRGATNATSQTVEVEVDGVAYAVVTPMGTSYNSYSTVPFTVSAGTHTIAFISLNPHTGDNTAFLDAITINTDL